MTLRYGLIGAGMMGQEHIRNAALMDDVKVTAVADPDEGMRSASAALADAKAYKTTAEMLASETFDALIIAAPNHTHHRILADVMAQDLPILCEKPLGVSAAQCNEIRDWAKARRAPVWVAMEYRYMPPLQELMGEVAAGRAGKLQMVSIREHRFPFLEKVSDWNRFSANTGGTLVEKCCHHFDLMRLILGAEPVRIYASAGVDVNHLDERYDGRVPDILDNAYVIVDFEHGLRGMLDLCMFAEGAHWQEVISAVGDKARIEARIPGPQRFARVPENHHSVLAIADRSERHETRRPVIIDPEVLSAGDHHGSTYYQHKLFADMIRTGGQPEVTLEDGTIAVAMGEAAQESAATGQSVAMEGRYV